MDQGTTEQAAPVIGHPGFGEWRPIETAPKDGTAVWLWHEGQAYIGYCRRSDWLCKADKWSAKFYVSRADEERKACGLPDETWGTNFEINPTHWMPLPPPPTPEA